VVNEEIKSLEPILISGSYNSVNDSIVINAGFKHNLWRKYQCLNERGHKDKALVYNLTIDDIQNKLIQLPYSGFWESSGQYCRLQLARKRFER
jgi:hypothetical protein